VIAQCLRSSKLAWELAEKDRWSDGVVSGDRLPAAWVDAEAVDTAKSLFPPGGAVRVFMCCGTNSGFTDRQVRSRPPPPL